MKFNLRNTNVPKIQINSIQNICIDDLNRPTYHHLYSTEKHLDSLRRSAGDLTRVVLYRSKKKRKVWLPRETFKQYAIWLFICSPKLVPVLQTKPKNRTTLKRLIRKVIHRFFLRSVKSIFLLEHLNLLTKLATSLFLKKNSLREEWLSLAEDRGLFLIAYRLFLRKMLDTYYATTPKSARKRGYLHLSKAFQHAIVTAANDWSGFSDYPKTSNHASFFSAPWGDTRTPKWELRTTSSPLHSPVYLLRFNRFIFMQPVQDLFTETDLEGLDPFISATRTIFKKPKFWKTQLYLHYLIPFWGYLNNFHYTYAQFFHKLVMRGRFDLFRSGEAIDIHHVIFKFNKHQFFISLMDFFKRRNYISLLPGLLIKYLEGRKKGAKKILTTKLLLVRFLRKILIMSGITHLSMLVKGLPLHLPQLFSFLNKPLPHIIIDPFTKKPIDETGEEYLTFKYFSLTFLNPKPYGYQKTQKKGRVKRKIRRKIIRLARVIDEA